MLENSHYQLPGESGHIGLGYPEARPSKGMAPRHPGGLLLDPQKIIVYIHITYLSSSRS